MFRMRQVHPAASLKVFDVGEHTPLFQACTNSITLFEAQPPNSSPLGSSTQGESMLGRFLAVGVLIGLAAVEFGDIAVRLPFPPGVEYDYMQTPPPGQLPPTWGPMHFNHSKALQQAKYLLADTLRGVETVAVREDGVLGLVDAYGKVYLAEPTPEGSYQLTTEEPLLYVTPGRPLGLMFDAEGTLYVASSPLGLMKVVAPGTPEQKLVVGTAIVSADSPLAPNTPVEFADGIDIASDGTVYFSHASDVTAYRTSDETWDAMDSVFVTLAKGAPAGMLCAYYPHNRSTHALMTGMWFANGVVLSPDESYVLVSDSLQANIHRYWLKGPQAGTHDIFMDNLPGPPDGLSRSSDGHYWVTVPAAFPPVVKLSQVRVARLLIAWMPRLMRLLRVPLPKMGLVLKLSPEGRIVQTLADPKGKVVDGVSSAVEHDGKLFLGTLKHQGVPVLDLASLHS